MIVKPGVLDIGCIDFKDPIFDSLRKDYLLFDEWVVKVKQDTGNRVGFGSYNSGGGLQNVALVKLEDTVGISKISTFKVEVGSVGFGLGSELMLCVLNFLKDWGGSSRVNIEFYPKHEGLGLFVERFGFSFDSVLPSGEVQFVKYF